jgi:UTP--glucose-1-phosphate uridylyltransferase
MTFPPVRKAVFPVAGMGTRFLPATKAMPKEMLPVVDKPLIQYAVEEAYAAGIREMIFVTGRHKRAIVDHYDMAYELERELEDAGKQALLDVVRSVKPDDMVCIAIRQPKALGLGHAVLCAEPLVAGEPFAVLLADDLMVGEPPVMAQMTARFAELGGSIVAVQEVPREHTKRYGIVAGEFLRDDLMDVRQFVEKPAPEAAPSNWGVAGRYVLTPEVFEQIRPDGDAEGLRAALRRQALRLRFQGRLPRSHGRSGHAACRPGRCAAPGAAALGLNHQPAAHSTSASSAGRAARALGWLTMATSTRRWPSRPCT